MKPENILCTEPDTIRKIKVCDFGISKMLKKKDQRMTTLCGTVSYTAPEVLRQKKAYDYTCDYWSIGVIMYILLVCLSSSIIYYTYHISHHSFVFNMDIYIYIIYKQCGYPPFWGDSDKEIEQQIVKSDIEFEDEDWEHISEPTRALVAGMLNKKPKDRLGPDDVLKLTWAVSAKSLSFKKSLRRFKRHHLKNKFHRHSLSKFEADSLISRNIFKVFNPRSNHQKNRSIVFMSIDDEKKNSEQSIIALGGAKNKRKSMKRTSRISQKAFLRQGSKDDMAPINDEMHAVESYERKIAAFRGRMSKGTEELLQLRLPITWTLQTDSPLEIIEDEMD